MYARSPIATGVLLALLAALSFGAATPFLKLFSREVDVFSAAGLLYAGAAAIAFMTRGRGQECEEARLRTSDAPRLVGIAALGAFVAPVLLAWGLKRTSGTSASLMLNLEAGFTVALGSIFYREHLGTRVIVAATLIALGGALLIFGHPDHAAIGTAHSLGLLAVLGASFAWALDNTMAKPLAERDVRSVVFFKCLLGAMFSLFLAILVQERVPSFRAVAGILTCGAIGYGASLRAYLLAQRRLGAARTASVFAAAPFVGALVACAMGESVGPVLLGAGSLMIIGVWLHMTEHHVHRHAHAHLEHDHAHDHDDGHHDHVHDPMPGQPHAHPHTHEAKIHGHSHAPDAHHEHEH